MSQLQPSQVRTLREGFQILDRDSDGMVVREDVIDMLNQLGRFLDLYQCLSTLLSSSLILLTNAGHL